MAVLEIILIKVTEDGTLLCAAVSADGDGALGRRGPPRYAESEELPSFLFSLELELLADVRLRTPRPLICDISLPGALACRNCGVDAPRSDRPLTVR